MDAPWLDSLSEDWDSQPASTRTSPDFEHTDGKAHAATSAPNSPRNSDSVSKYDSVRSPVRYRNLDGSGVGVLVERSISGLNILSHSSKHASITKAAQGQDHSVPLHTMSMKGSVLRHDGLSRRSKSSSPPKNRTYTRTPEWKKLIVKGLNGVAAQNDLFSPIGLAGIFQQPLARGTHRSPISKSTLSLFQSVEAMPSSPPPWPRGIQDRRRSSSLSQETSILIDRPESGFAKVNWQLHGSHTHATSPLPILCEAPASQRGSSVSEGFSPVYISKHNNLDGQVDYAAIDMSDPRVQEQVKAFRSSTVDQRSEEAQEDDEDADILPNHKVRLASWSTPSRARENDTAAEPWSAQASSSILPSDSLSQIGLKLESRETFTIPRLDPEQVQSKRPAPSPFKGPTPKRQRTLGLEELVPLVARLASKSEEEELEEVHAHMVNIPAVNEPDNAARLKAVASEVAIFHLKVLEEVKDTSRKPSVSTQDYLNEATKIMEIIRARKGLPKSELSSVEESEVEVASQLSRPPSREGVVSAWRTKEDGAVDTKTLDQLRMYEETGDESFILSSLQMEGVPGNPGNLASENEPFDGNEQRPRWSQRSDLPSNQYNHSNGLVDLAQIVGREEEEQKKKKEEKRDEEETEPANVRISGPRPLTEDHAVSPITNQMKHASAESPSKSHRSNPSTDSTGRTVQTYSSQRTRTVPVISPGKVQHLIDHLEGAAGMHFDRNRQAWVKDKSVKVNRNSQAYFSSSTGSEDPFDAISDLAVNEVDKKSLSNSVGHETEQWWARKSYNENSSSLGYTPEVLFSVSQELDFYGGNLPADPVAGSATSPNFAKAPEGEEEPTTEVYPERRRAQPVETLEILDEESEESTGSVVVTPQQTSKRSKESVERRRWEQSVIFSSPPVSRQWESRRFVEGSGLSDLREEGMLGELVDGVEAEFSERDRDDWQPQHSMNRVSRVGPHFSSREVSLLRIDEHREISFSETRPNGRCMSLTLNVSTPLPMNRLTALGSISRNISLGNFFPPLSPISDFTVEQNDARHFESRNLLGSTRQLTLADRSVRSAVVVDKLVAKLTDVEPDEPYWDSIRALSLSKKDLQNVHQLDTFCPSIEELDVSDNQLQQLTGAPMGLRHMNVRNNSLSSLTTWGHLIHLQYLDISGNDVDSLESLAELVHLRSLKADNNSVTSIEGAFDLDGLLSLSLKNNKLSQVDFHSADLRRLATLDLTGNSIQNIQGLHCLPQLTALDLSHNKLVGFGTTAQKSKSCVHLREIRMSHNEIKSMDCSSFPSLRFINVDHNHLAKIDSITNLQHLQTLSMRNQTSHPDSTDSLSTHLDDYSELNTLYLSGNGLSTFSITIHFLKLHTLELAFTGLQSLPHNFGNLMPNLRVLNLNHNALKDLKPLRGIVNLQRLMVAGNRMSRLRKAMRIVERFGPTLKELDSRDNPFSVGFYGPWAISVAETQVAKVNSQQDNIAAETVEDEIPLQHVLPSPDASQDSTYNSKLDEDTRLKRRVYELLLAAKCTRLEKVDGLRWARERVLKKDETWKRLVDLGVIERVGDEDEANAVTVTGLGHVAINGEQGMSRFGALGKE